MQPPFDQVAYCSHYLVVCTTPFIAVNQQFVKEISHSGCKLHTEWYITFCPRQTCDYLPTNPLPNVFTQRSSADT